ncbi:MAG: flagellin [Synergistaceae bacterium]|nr:flagellin [Synergistaceae bacterium]
MVINHNIPALQSYNIVNNTSNALQKSIAKLSSGLRINSAADDAAGLAISEKMRAQIRGLDKAVANTQDGISLIQTAEGALSETHSILQRMRELSVQAANDTLTQQDRSYIQVEIDQLNEEITRIGNTTQFNKKKLLNGEAAALWSSDDNETKAIINGGLRTTDQFGQKVSVEGNYKIRVKADPGQGEVQKSDIMKVKHDNVVMNKSVNTDAGVKDVAVDNVAAGSYTLTYRNALQTDDPVLTGSYGLGGYTSTTTTTGTTLNQTTAPVTKISVQTTDGVEIWSTSGADIFGSNGSPVTGSTQGTYFAGGDDSDTGRTFAGVADEIITAARQKGINLTTTFAADSDQVTFTAITNDGSVAPGIKIVYEGGGDSGNPTTGTIAYGTTPTYVPPTDAFALDASGTAVQDNASILFEVTDVNAVNQTVTLKATASILSQNGVSTTATQDNIVLSASSGNSVALTQIFGGDSTDSATITLGSAGIGAISDGAKFVYFVSAQSDNVTPDMAIQVDGIMDSSWEEKWDGGPFNGNSLNYNLNADLVSNTDIHLKSYFLNEKTGVAELGDIKMSTDSTFKNTNGALNTLADETILSSFDAAYIGKVATDDVKLRDLDKFWNSEGVFMLDDAKTITLNQADGKTANVTLYGYDTLGDVAKKLNNAVATGLGQAQYVDDATKFVTFVNGATTDSEAVEGTFLIRSAVPGKEGEITLSGDENILNALSLNTIQKATETTFTVDVSNAHTGETIASNVKVTGNVAHGLIDKNVDIEFSSLKGINASWNSKLNKFVYSSSTQETTLHIADNTTVLQIGANEGEDMAMNIGDMRSHALGLDGVNVMSHDRAARSITIIDNAIDKVSTQRANLGAYQNRLEYTANNLTTASENLTSAESRIRDTDMAKEMMNFTKLNIMLQAGNSMLAQANQQPQNVLSLIR